VRSVLRVAWYRFRSTFRRRWGGYLAIVLLIGLVGGVSMGAVAGARRTQSSFRAFLASTNPSDISVPILGGGNNPPLIRAIARLAHVKRVERAAFPNVYELGVNGAPSAGPSSVGLIGSADGEYFNQDRAVAVQGRTADPRREDEMVITADVGRALHVHVGSVLRFGFWTTAQTANLNSYDIPKVKPYFWVDIKVVGVVVLNNTLIQDDIDRSLALAIITPALMRRVDACPTSCEAGYSIAGVQVDGGRRNVLSVERELEGVLPTGLPPLFHLTSIVETQADTAIKPESIALGVFGLIAALAALLIAAQVIGRQLHFRADDLDTLRALGAGPALTSTDGLIGTIGSILGGSVLAGAVGVGLSPLSPIGLVRPAYPSRGIAFDWTVLGIGIALLIVALTAFAVAVAVRQAPHRFARRSRKTVPHGSRVARTAATSGLSAPAVAGIRFALEPGQGRNAVPVRSALIATALAVAIVVATVVFGSSLDTLISHPKLYGWNWSYALQAGNFGPIPPSTQAALSRDPDVAAWSPIGLVPLVHIGSLSTPALVEEPHASLTPPILSGHALDAPHEVVLGTATLAQLHKHVGDTVIASYGLAKNAPKWIPPTPVRIVGTATLPTIGLFGDQHTSMSTGALLSDGPGLNALKRAQQRQQGRFYGPDMVLIQLRHGIRPVDGLVNLQRIADTTNADKTVIGNGWIISVLPVQRPAQIVNYRSMGNTPALLAAALAAGAIVALTLTLTTSVRRRRRDLALLKTLGFTHRQLITTVAVQASVAAIIGTLIGLPAGILAGRQLWTRFAHEIAAVPQPNVPTYTILLTAIGALALANLVAAIPGRRAARTPTAVLLHAE
jgi:hypothetical protein